MDTYSTCQKMFQKNGPFSFVQRYLLRGLVDVFDSCAVPFLACFVLFIAFHVISTDVASNWRQRWTFSE